MSKRGRRWARWGGSAVGMVGVVGIYALAGGWLLPRLLQDQLPGFAQQQWQRQASVDAIRFNPFTLRFEVDGLRLAEADGAPLFGIEHLAVGLQWRSLWQRTWNVAEVRLVAPSVQLAIDRQGSFNIAGFLATLDKNKTDEAPAPLPRLTIGHLAIERGRVDMDDRHAGYADTYAPIAFTLDNLSTLPDAQGRYTLTADAGLGGKLRWQGEASMSPMAGSGTLTLDKLALPGISGYLQAYAPVQLAGGRLSASLPYRYAYRDGKLDAQLKNASLGLDALELKAAGRVDGDKAAEARFRLGRLRVHGVSADLLANRLTLGSVRFDDGVLAYGAPQSPGAAALVEPVSLAALALEGVTVELAARRASVQRVHAHGGQLDLSRDGEGRFVFLRDLPSLAAAPGAALAPAVAPAPAAAPGGVMPAAALAPSPSGKAAAAQGGDVAPVATVRTAADSQSLWSLAVASVELDGFGAHYADAANGLQANLQDLRLKVAYVSTDLDRPLAFDGSVGLREGGQLAAQGKVVPASGAVDAQLALSGLALAPLQPLLDQHVKLKLASGVVSAAGRLRVAGRAGSAVAVATKADDRSAAAVRYDGAFEVAGLALDEHDGDHFARWKLLRAERLALTVGPNKLDLPELRVVEPQAILIIDSDRSLNAQRLLVAPSAAPQGAGGEPVAAASAASGGVSVAAMPAPAAGKPAHATATAATAGEANAANAAATAGAANATDTAGAPGAAEPPGSEAFPVHLRRVRFENAQLDFTDLSLRPQFAAKMVELNGVITGLSTRRDARAQIELDGRVDDYGLARIHGQLNPFAPTDNTDLQLVFKNLDLVSASPYSMKFAGYKIAEGKISLDLGYRVRHGELQGDNRVVLDRLTLGERSDSPDALKLPLELALALLKDGDGRIDLGIPVTGNLNDPQFRYGEVVWKAVGNVLTKVVTAPFRALGRLFGVAGERYEAVEFDAGSARLLPPEREKLQQMAAMLAKKPALALIVPGQYNAEADGLALREDALRRAVLARAEVRLDAGESPGPLDIGNRKVRGALRALYAERFGDAALDQQKQAAEQAAERTAEQAAERAAKQAAVHAAAQAAVHAVAQAADRAAAHALAQPAAQVSAPAAAPAPAANTARAARLPLLQRMGKLVQGEPQVADPAPFYAALQERLVRQQVLPADALAQLGAQRAAAIVAALKSAGAQHVSAAATENINGAPGKPVALKLGLSAK